MKTCFFVETDGACDYYRAGLPITTASAHGHMQSERVWPHNIITDVMYQPERFNKYMEADAFLIPRANTRKFVKRIQKTIQEKNSKAKIVIDFDDDVFNVSPFSPHYVDYGLSDVKVNLNGEMLDLWKDGKNINLKHNRERADDTKWCIGQADMLTVTTDYLAHKFKGLNKNVRVLPNCVDVNLFERQERKKDTVDLFWAGGWSHYEDWYVIKDVLPAIMDKYKNVRLIVMGHLFDGLTKSIDPKRLVFHDWVDTVAYPYKLSLISPDICIIPLKDSDFNRCKSPIKWIEMAALKVPSVSTYIPPYSAMADHGENNGVYIADNEPDLWIQGLSELIEDEKLRNETGERAYQTVKEHYDINTQYNQWVNAYQEVLCQSRQTQPLLK